MPNTFQLPSPGLQVGDEQVQLTPVQMFALVQQEKEMPHARGHGVAGEALPGQEVIYQLPGPQSDAGMFLLLPFGEQSPIRLSHQHQSVLQRHVTMY